MGWSLDHHSRADEKFHITHEVIDHDERYGPLYEAEPGHDRKMGVSVEADGCNVALRAGDADFIDICIYDQNNTDLPLERWRLTGKSSEKHGVMHGFIPGMKPGDLYGIRAHGEWNPTDQKTFNYNKLLIDPYARAMTGSVVSSHPDGTPVYAITDYVDDHGNYLAPNETDSAPWMPRCVVVDERYDWEGDKHPNIPASQVVLYEGHLKGMTQMVEEIPEALRGTYAGLGSEPVTRHLNELGVTSVELLPLQQFAHEHHLQQKGMKNYWGYNTLGFFAPHNEYSSSGDRGEQVREFKYMVKKLHEAGIEVILDVVYNHTPEGSEFGPTLSFKGLNSKEMYLFSEHGHHTNYSGTGNTVNASSEAGAEMIIDSLRYWVEEMHVDGFRFDLATILVREAPYGSINMNNRFMEMLKSDPVLRNTKLYAEPWDCGGYELGAFKQPWGEWNDQLRDTIREFWLGYMDAGALASKLAGSQHVDNSVNFVTAHDGFTLKDLVSYNHKHNYANGEGNRDGADNNRSWNFGTEGETDDPYVNEMRKLAMRSMFLSTMMAAGTPMISHGDEIMRTQGGNNNAYCQDSEIAWINWNLSSEQRDFLKFTSGVTKFRSHHPQFARKLHFDNTPSNFRTEHELVWFKANGEEFHHGDYAWRQQFLGMYMSGLALSRMNDNGYAGDADSLLYYANGTADDYHVTLPHQAPYAGKYELLIDTSSGEVAPEGSGKLIDENQLCVKALSSVVLRRRYDI